MIRSILVLGLVVACGAQPPSPDAHSTVPRTAAGTFAVQSRFDFPLPDAARPVLATLAEATDGPDDPSRFIVDAMVARLPAGPVATAATAAAPFVAAYLNTRLAEIAPKLAPGLAQLTAQLARIAQHLETAETFRIAPDGVVIRSVTGVRFAVGAGVEMPFETVGLPELAATAKIEMHDGRLGISTNAIAVPYAQILRLGLDRVVIPSVAPGATDLGAALRALVDCTRLGELVAEELGLGSAAGYASACGAAMTAIAARIDGQLEAIGSQRLVVSGTATGYDLDGDGAMDAIHDGAWLGQPGSSFVVTGGTFAGTR